ncbi:MAG TPA: nucleoside monophosphate kinase [Candidatus Saccharimonadales bacterium]|nr:nucleoside monophosphate kinase [Candidatus Saccharimonadales bacterium]
MQEDVAFLRQWLGQGSVNVFGMPFAGKDTQCRKLAVFLKGEMLGGGEILRNSALPPDAKKVIDEGQLSPSDVYVRVVLPFLSQEKFDDKPLILSSVGRWYGEEQSVMQATAAAGHPIRAAVLLTVPEEIARTRHANLSADGRGARADDAVEFFNTRLSEFRTKTMPVIEFYRNKDMLIEVDGNQPATAVSETIIAKLLAYARVHPAATEGPRS